MKKTLSILAVLALSGMMASAATILQDVSLSTTTIDSFNPSTSTEGGSFSGFTAVLNSDWLAAADSTGTPLSGDITAFTLQTLTLNQRNAAGGGYVNFTECKLAIRDNSTENYLSVSNVSATNDGKVSFNFGMDGIQLDMDTNYSFFFVTASTTLNGDTITGGQFLKNQFACWSNANAGTADTSTGLATDTTTGALNGFKAGITLTGTATVPEPATASLSLLGLSALLLRRRKS